MRFFSDDFMQVSPSYYNAVELVTDEVDTESTLAQAAAAALNLL
jgi:hypothetical protein